jgi:hypothetical protein
MNKTKVMLNFPFDKDEQWVQLVREFQKEMGSELRLIGGKKVRYNVGYFIISGFFTYDGGVYYFSLPDVRFSSGYELLIREAKSYKDFTGGANKYYPLEKGMLKKIFYE